VLRVAAGMAPTDDPTVVGAALAREACRIAGADVCTIHLQREQTITQLARYAGRHRERSNLLVAPCSASVPLVYEGRLLGVIELAWHTRPVRDFVIPADLSVLCEIAAAKLVKAIERVDQRERVNALETLNTQLRKQVHEYANHLQALSGLYELGDTAAASGLLAQMIRHHGDSPVTRVSHVEDPVVAGTLVALMRVAEQRRVRLDLNPSCRVRRLPSTLNALDVVTVLANCIGNALDAVSEVSEARRRRVVLMVVETSHDLRLTVRDWGPGLSGRSIEELTRPGVSTKPGHHGVGLTVVSEITEKRGGRLSLRSLDPGALLTISLPWS
jgi:sensor histidine kinase regulating citrate/malate metabolism